MPSNLRTIVMKLPYKLREKWRSVACDIHEQTGRRAVFVDLVNFIEKQVKIVSDPLFGNIQDTPSSSQARTATHMKQRKKGGTFATNVNSVKGGDDNRKIAPTPDDQIKCIFCQHTNHELDKCSQLKSKTQQDKIHSLKERGICFGCLKFGHTSKDCRSRLDCEVCHRKHPSLLHVEKEDVKRGTVSPSVQQTCDHIGAGEEDRNVFSIVAVKVRDSKRKKVVCTYAFLDPGSSRTFCTTDLAKRLGVTGKPETIMLKTMGQVKSVKTTAITGL